MAAIDFITAFGRLLHDGALRDAFAADARALARRLEVRECDEPAFVRLEVADLEFQARILLRKRFGLVGEALPQTCRDLGRDGWAEFLRYGRSTEPTLENQTTVDAFGFSRHLLRVRPASVCRLESNRARFADGRRRFALHVVRTISVRGRHRLGAQVFLRVRRRAWHEWLFYLDG